MIETLDRSYVEKDVEKRETGVNARETRNERLLFPSRIGATNSPAIKVGLA